MLPSNCSIEFKRRNFVVFFFLWGELFSVLLDELEIEICCFQIKGGPFLSVLWCRAPIQVLCRTRHGSQVLDGTLRMPSPANRAPYQGAVFRNGSRLSLFNVEVTSVKCPLQYTCAKLCFVKTRTSYNFRVPCAGVLLVRRKYENCVVCAEDLLQQDQPSTRLTVITYLKQQVIHVVFLCVV